MGGLAGVSVGGGGRVALAAEVLMVSRRFWRAVVVGSLGSWVVAAMRSWRRAVEQKQKQEEQRQQERVRVVLLEVMRDDQATVLPLSLVS